MASLIRVLRTSASEISGKALNSFNDNGGLKELWAQVRRSLQNEGDELIIRVKGKEPRKLFRLPLSVITTVQLYLHKRFGNSKLGNTKIFKKLLGELQYVGTSKTSVGVLQGDIALQSRVRG